MTANQQALVVFLEIINPTSRDIELSRLEYRVSARSWFDGEGEVGLSRAVGADSAAVVEVPLRLRRIHGDVDAGAGARVSYSFSGKLFAVSERGVERSWDIQAEGLLSAGSVANIRRGVRIRTRVAGDTGAP